MTTKTRKPYAQIGTVISATLNPRDLIPAFASTLEALMEHYEWQGMTSESEAHAEYAALIADADDWIRIHNVIALSDGDTDHLIGRANEILEALFDALESFAPPYTYFGTLEGDGSDFGFWPLTDQESLADARDSGYCVDISDHGNVALYDSDDREVWAVV